MFYFRNTYLNSEKIFTNFKDTNLQWIKNNTLPIELMINNSGTTVKVGLIRETIFGLGGSSLGYLLLFP